MKEQIPGDQREDFEKLSQELIDPTKKDERIEVKEEVEPKQG